MSFLGKALGAGGGYLVGGPLGAAAGYALASGGAPDLGDVHPGETRTQVKPSDPSLYQWNGPAVAEQTRMRDAAYGRQSAKIDNAAAQQYYGQLGQVNAGQSSLAQQLAAQAAGQGDSAAQRQLKAGQEAGFAQQLAMANSARGSQVGAARYAAMQQGAQGNAQLNQQMGVLRAQEAAQARGELAGVYAQQAGQNLAAVNAQQGIAMGQAELQQRQNQLNVQEALGYNQGAIAAGQAQLQGGIAQGQNQMTAEQINAGIAAQNAQASTNFWGSLFQGVGTAAAAYGGGKSDERLKTDIQPAGGQSSIGDGHDGVNGIDGTKSSPQVSVDGGYDALPEFTPQKDTPKNGFNGNYIGPAPVADPYGVTGIGNAFARELTAQRQTALDTDRYTGAVSPGGGNPSWNQMIGSGMDVRGSAARFSRDATVSPRMGVGGYSDARLKRDIQPGGHTVSDSFLDALSKSESTFKYKNPADEPSSTGPTGGKYLGVIAQDVQKTPTGDTLVKRGPDGLMLDTVPTLSAALAGLGRLNERLQVVEDGLKRYASKKGGK